MTVLFIVGLIVLVLVVYLIVKAFNEYTNKKYKYEFFHVGSLFIVSISYGCLYFGYFLYEKAVRGYGDILGFKQNKLYFGNIWFYISVSCIYCIISSSCISNNCFSSFCFTSLYVLSRLWLILLKIR